MRFPKNAATLSCELELNLWKRAAGENRSGAEILRSWADVITGSCYPPFSDDAFILWVYDGGFS